MTESKNIPDHVAIIPDGNRRWARAYGLEPWEGHEAGAENTEKLIRAAKDLGIRELSLWGSSIGNLTKRPAKEKLGLLRVYETHFKRLLESEDVVRDRVRIRIIGRWREYFPESLQSILDEAVEETKDHDRYFLNFFLAYNGTDDMVEAFRGVARERLGPEAITEDTVKSHLMTAELPPVDLLIRTGGEAHLSAGFLMWDTAESQLLFSDLLYPDFGPEAFKSAVIGYGERERRYGK